MKNADARDIELIAEVADAPGTAVEGTEAADPIRVRWDDRGRLLEFPFASQGKLSQVAVRRSAAGRIMKLGVTAMNPGKPAEAGASAGEGGAASSIAFAYGADGLAESASLEGEGAGSFAFTYRGARDEAGKPRGSALETRAGESGEVTGVFDYAFGGGRILRVDGRGETGERVSLRSMDYDASGRVVAVTEGDYRAEALYAARGRVVYWRIAASAEISGADSESTDAATERRFQWDERNFLVRESVAEAGEAYEVRYEYATDSRGNWVERRATRWVQRFGALVSEGGTRVRRTIRYR